jgi:hypothetical protein
MIISALALVNRGEVAWIEDPGFYQARRAFGSPVARSFRDRSIAKES